MVFDMLKNNKILLTALRVPRVVTLAEFILETENRLRPEAHHKTGNSSNVIPVRDEFPVSIFPSNFPGQTDEKVVRNMKWSLRNGVEGKGLITK